MYLKSMSSNARSCNSYGRRINGLDYDSNIFPSNFIDENQGEGVWE